MILIKIRLQIFLLLILLASGLFVSAQVRVIDNKGTVSIIDTSRAITGAAIYQVSPEQYSLSGSSAVKSGTIAIFTATSTNTTTTPCLKAGTQTTGIVITKNGHQALVPGDIAADVPSIVIFDATNWVLQTPQGSSSGGVTTIGTPTTSYATGASMSGTTLTMGLADAMNPGLVSTGLQTFAGQKIFTNPTTVFGAGEGGTPATTFIRGPQAGGSGTAGADLYIQASNGTGAGGSGSIVFQTATAATISLPAVSNVVNQAFGNSISQTLAGYTVPSAGINKVLMVEVNLGYTGLSVTSVTYNGIALSSLGYITSGNNRMEIWYLVAPIAGTSKDIVVTLNNYSAVGLTAMTWSNVNQTNPFGTMASTNNGNGSTVSLLPSSSLGQVVMDFLTTTTSPVTATAGQNVFTSFHNGSSCYNTSGYKAATTGSTTMSYSFASSNYGYMAFAINPSTVGGSNALTDALKISNTGNTVLASGKKLVFTDNSTGTVGLTVPASVASYTLTLPINAGASNEILTTDGAGNLSWTSSGLLPSLSATAPLNYNSGNFSISQATSGTSGYLSSTDWSTFNSKAPNSSPTFTGTLTNNGTFAGTAILGIANGGTGSSTQNWVDLTTTQSIGGAKAFTSAITVSPFTAAGVVHNSAAGLLSSSLVGLTSDVSGILPGANGGTGIDNTGKTITLGGNLTTSGAFATTLNTTGTTSVTLPTYGTLVNSGVLVGITTLTTSSASPYTPTVGTSKMLVYIVGGGGGGGGCRNSNGSAGGGGGAGAVAIKLITHTSGTTYSFSVGTAGTVGAAGSGANGGTGGTGGTSIFNGVTVSGGAGGVGGTATSSIPVSGGTGGTLPTGGDVNIPGDSGTNGVRFANTAGAGLTGAGASSPFGRGGQGRTASTGAGGAASGYGAGGGGALGATASVGGAGTPGVIVIYEYK